MNDPMQLLRDMNPVDDCAAPDFERLLTRLDDGLGDRIEEGTNRLRSQIPATRRILGFRSLTVVVPILVTVAVVVVALVSLHGSAAHAPGRACRLHEPGTDRVTPGVCPSGLTLGSSPARLRTSDVRSPVRVIARTIGNRVRVTTRLRTRVASSEIAGYGLRLSTPGYNPRLKAPGRGCSLPGGGTVATLIGIGTRFHAGQVLTETTALARCPGTYHGAVIAHPLVGPPLIVARFTFRAPRR